MPPRKSPAKEPKAQKTPAPPSQPERDYLVIFEEPDLYGLPADDSLVLDIEQPTQGRAEVDVLQKVDIELTNTTSRMGTVGILVTSLGAFLGAALMVAFAMVYPGQWDGGTHRTMFLLAVLTLVLLVGGTMLTHYGRRIQAHGRLSDVRIVEKESKPTARLG